MSGRKPALPPLADLTRRTGTGSGFHAAMVVMLE
jgi:hypothetical protein